MLYNRYIMKLNSQSVKDVVSTVVIGLIGLVVIIAGAIGASWWFAQQPASCNVAEITLYGQVVYYPNESTGASVGGLGDGSLDQTAAEDVRQEIESADADSSIQAIMLQVDSPGGDPVAGEEIAAALKQATKPTVAFIADQGTSAAYWASTGAQKIFASADSAVGDIGVTESYLDQTQQDSQSGLKFVSLTAGVYKDMGDPNTPLTPAEKNILQDQLNIVYNNFVAQVAANRNLSVASVTALANGSPIIGEQAVADGLIDATGTIYDVEDYLRGKIGDDVTFCGN
jgi:protease IV